MKQHNIVVPFLSSVLKQGRFCLAVQLIKIQFFSYFNYFWTYAHYSSVL